MAQHRGMAVYDTDDTLLGYTVTAAGMVRKALKGRDGVTGRGGSLSSRDTVAIWVRTAEMAEAVFRAYGKEQARPATPARWQDQPATERQIRYLVDLGVQIEPGLTKGRASQLIDAAKGGDGVEYMGGEYAEGMQSIGEVY